MLFFNQLYNDRWDCAINLCETKKKKSLSYSGSFCFFGSGIFLSDTEVFFYIKLFSIKKLY